jgi:aminopeptidase N
MHYEEIYKCKYSNKCTLIFGAFETARNIGSCILLPQSKYLDVRSMSIKEKSAWIAGIAHEISHYYWGQLVMCDVFESPWLIEGFAEYAALNAVNSLHGEQYVNAYIESNRKRYVKSTVKRLSILETSLIDKCLWEVAYYRASMLLWKLSQEIGETQMLRILREWISENENQCVKTEALLA